MKKVLVIVGPTGVGKTKLSISLAKAYGYEIISGDSMQIYKDMNIGTGKVTKEEMDGVPHHLLDIKNVNESYSCADFQFEVRKKIDEILSRGKNPLIVGGTGLYLRACLYDYVFEQKNEHNMDIELKYSHLSNEELHNYLEKIDVESAKKFHPNNRRRVLRAIEIYEKSGYSKTDNLAMQEHKLLYDALVIGLDIDRTILHSLQDKRIDKMFEDGLEEEVKKIYTVEGFLDGGASKAIGYKEFLPYFDNKITLEEVKNMIKIHTHQYSKRQYTWFKNQMEVKWIKVDVCDFNNTLKEAHQLIDHWINGDDIVE